MEFRKRWKTSQKTKVHFDDMWQKIEEKVMKL